MFDRLLLLACLLALPAAAGGEDVSSPATTFEALPLPDWELAQDAVERGEILPLAEILDIVQLAYPGDLVEVEIEIEDGLRVYEVEVLTPDGRLLEVDLDAATGTIVDVDEEDPPQASTEPAAELGVGSDD